MRELTGEDLAILTNFEQITKVMPSDYLMTENFTIFIVTPANLGRCIGPKGANIEKLRKVFRKKVIVIKDADDPEQFLRNFFVNIAIEGFEHRNIMGEVNYIMTIDEKDRGVAIGKSGERVKAAKEFLKKKFNATMQIKTKRADIYQNHGGGFSGPAVIEIPPEEQKKADETQSLEDAIVSESSSEDKKE